MEWEVYFNTGIIKISKIRAALTPFRCLGHVLNIEMGRRNSILLEDRLCAFCENNGIVVIEGEFHFYCIVRVIILYLKNHLVLYNVISYSNFIEIMTAKMLT